MVSILFPLFTQRLTETGARGANGRHAVSRAEWAGSPRETESATHRNQSMAADRAEVMMMIPSHATSNHAVCEASNL